MVGDLDQITGERNTGIRCLHERYRSPRERDDTEVSNVSALLIVSYRSQRTF
jgi:hypothetical protein